MKKAILLFLMALGFILGPASTNASAATASVTLAWNPSTNSDVVGYSLYYGVASQVYTNKVVFAAVNSGTISGLVPGNTYYFAATASDSLGLESDFSNEVSYSINPVYSLDGTYVASSGYAINAPNGVITGIVSPLPADPKSVGWAKDLGPIAAGQIVKVSARVFYSGSAAPVSFYLVNRLTGSWLGPERVAFVDSSYGSNSVELIVGTACNNPRLYVSTGQQIGGYEFQQIQVSTVTPAVSPITDLYLRQLLPKQTAGLYSTEWVWNPVPGSQGYVVRATPFRDEIEKGAAGIMLTSQTLPASQTSFRRDIDATLYGGVYLAVSSLVGGQESVPWITWYLPGDIFNTADEEIPPLCFQGTVDADDVNYAYAGYTSSRRTPALTPGQPAGRDERTDIDNNAYAGRVSDYSFIRSQNGKRMQ